MLYQSFIITSCLLTLLLSGCTSQEKEGGEDIEISQEQATRPRELTTVAYWLPTRWHDPFGKVQELTLEVLEAGGPQDALSFTNVQVSIPVSLFKAEYQVPQSEEGEDPAPDEIESGLGVSNVAFLAFKAEEDAVVTVRDIKSVSGQNILSQVVQPIGCPETFLKEVEQFEIPSFHTEEYEKNNKSDSLASMTFSTYCIPLINNIIKDFLVPTDSSGSYVHNLSVNIKKPGSMPKALTLNMGIRVVIPDAQMVLDVSDDFRSLSLRDRLTIFSNDLKGSPRRDFKAFEILGEIAPGVQTSWVITLSDIKLSFEEEVFFEQPVLAGSTPARPIIARGNAFYKRNAVIDSAKHFKVLLVSGEDEAKRFTLPSNGDSIVIETEIIDGSNPFRFFLVPDFANDSSVVSMSEYVKPFTPTFCPKEQGGFKAEEWRQSLEKDYYFACDAKTRTRIVDLNDAISKKVTIPIETFFGSFSYMPRIGTRILGGTNGVLSFRASLSGNMTVAVRNPHDTSTVTEIGSIPLSYTFMLPTVIAEMDELIKSGNGTPSLDTIYTAMMRKGIRALPKRDGGKKPAFPFMGYDKEEIIY